MKGVSFYPQCNGSSDRVFFCTEPENIQPRYFYSSSIIPHKFYFFLFHYSPLWAVLFREIAMKNIYAA